MFSVLPSPVFELHDTCFYVFIAAGHILPGLPLIFLPKIFLSTAAEHILTQCTQRMYLMKLLKHQGMPQQQLSVITHSIIVSRILYALPAW